MKEQYINMRNNKVIDLGVLYTYAREKGMTLSEREFQIGCNFFNFSEALENIDREFKLNVLVDKNGNFIKVTE